MVDYIHWMDKNLGHPRSLESSIPVIPTNVMVSTMIMVSFLGAVWQPSTVLRQSPKIYPPTTDMEVPTFPEERRVCAHKPVGGWQPGIFMLVNQI